MKKQRSWNDSIISNIHDYYSGIVKYATETQERVEQEYAEFKEKNSIDYYFQKNLNNDTKKKLLDRIDELKNSTDWGRVDKYELQQLGPSNPERELEFILKENEIREIKRAREIIEDQRSEADQGC